MEIKATYRFAGSPQAVWAVLMDPEAIKSCLPECRELRPAGDNRYQAQLAIGLAAVTGTFDAMITLSDLAPPDSFRLTVDAKGKPGFARGVATIILTPTMDGTEVAVTATSEAGGLIARLGQRLLEGVARMTMDRFFHCLASR